MAARNGNDGRQRCAWAFGSPALRVYHDREWGVPAHDDRRLFEMLILEGAQAGLSWRTILDKRAAYRRAFDNFDVERVAGYSADKLADLMQDAGIVRNRLKIEATVVNARRFLEVVAERGSFHGYIWDFIQGAPIQNRWHGEQAPPAYSPESDAMSKDLKNRGFKFVGTTICYALMQAIGMVNDHMVDCFRHAEIVSLAENAR
ncbi:MAG: DNA-3-methyladenine glycosylase I [Gammaproteobacteria bacterium]|nr:DNA-3-methyladenine glycosylase I [Gammaproteobacteria bacterium]MBA3730956.1 DNA-3-methyladenine glycosylase I [Gammaproteobacteria bacterium]